MKNLFGGKNGGKNGQGQDNYKGKDDNTDIKEGPKQKQGYKRPLGKNECADSEQTILTVGIVNILILIVMIFNHIKKTNPEILKINQEKLKLIKDIKSYQVLNKYFSV